MKETWRMQTYTCELSQRHWLSDRTYEVELTRPAGFDFSAGQNIRFFHRSAQRHYAPISSPADPFLKLCVFEMAGGVFSPYLASTPIGTEFTFSGPHGYFVFRPSNSKPVFIATGTGIAPYLSMARAGVRGFTLLHIVPQSKELYFRQFFEETADAYVPCVPPASEPGGDMLDLSAGEAIDYMSAHLPAEPHDFYLCGNQSMVRDVTLFVDSRFPGSRVYHEVFFRS